MMTTTTETEFSVVVLGTPLARSTGVAREAVVTVAMVQGRAALIDEYIELHPSRPMPSEARVRGRGVPVWALIARYRLTPGEDAIERVARAYRIPPAAVEAAIAYYGEHQGAIDARIAGLAVVA